MHDRLVWTGVACQLLERRDTVPALLSHQHLNELNFLLLETFYLGLPCVHNARAFRRRAGARRAPTRSRIASGTGA